MNRKAIGIIAAAITAVIGTILLIVFVQSAEDRALEGEELVTVLRADRSIPLGTPASELDAFTSVEEVPAKIAPSGAISDLVQVSGLVTTVEVLEGEVLFAARFAEPGTFTPGRGAIEVPEGLLEVTIAMSQEQFVGGVPVPGSKVALIVNGRRVDFIPANTDPLLQGATPEVIAENTDLTVSKIIIQQALVTNVQGNPLPAQPTVQTATDRVAPASGSLLVTLALDGPDVERLLYVRDSQSLNANLHMALHSGEALVPSEGISVENIINPEAPVG